MSLLGTNPLIVSTVGGNTEAADLGRVYVAMTPTPGTGIIGFATSTTLAIGSINPDFYLYNPGPLTIYPLYARQHITVVSTASVVTQYTQFLDVGNRITSAAITATALTINNTNMASPNRSNAVAYVGANTLAANTSQWRLVAQSNYRGTIDVVHDTYGFMWGTPDLGASVSIAATVMEINRVYAPIASLPGMCFGITHWSASQSAAPTAEWEFCYLEM